MEKAYQLAGTVSNRICHFRIYRDETDKFYFSVDSETIYGPYSTFDLAREKGNKFVLEFKDRFIIEEEEEEYEPDSIDREEMEIAEHKRIHNIED